MGKTILSSLWNEIRFPLSDAGLLYHHIKKKKSLCPDTTGIKVSNMISKWDNGISSGRAGQRRIGQSPPPPPENEPPLLNACSVCSVELAQSCALWGSDCFNQSLQSLLILKHQAGCQSPLTLYTYMHTFLAVWWSFSPTFSITVALKWTWAPSSRRTLKLPVSLLYSWRFSN